MYGSPCSMSVNSTDVLHEAHTANTADTGEYSHFLLNKEKPYTCSWDGIIFAALDTDNQYALEGLAHCSSFNFGVVIEKRYYPTGNILKKILITINIYGKAKNHHTFFRFLQENKLYCHIPEYNPTIFQYEKPPTKYNSRFAVAKGSPYERNITWLALENFCNEDDRESFSSFFRKALGHREAQEEEKWSDTDLKDRENLRKAMKAVYQKDNNEFFRTAKEFYNNN